MIEPRPETLELLREKFHRIAYERGHLPRVVHRLERRPFKARPQRTRSTGGGKSGTLPPLLPEMQAKVNFLYNTYLERARRRGKDLRRQCQRQPYYMIAIRWAQRSPEERSEQYGRAKKTIRQKRYYYGIMSRSAKQRMKGIGHGGGHDRT